MNLYSTDLSCAHRGCPCSAFCTDVPISCLLSLSSASYRLSIAWVFSSLMRSTHKIMFLSFSIFSIISASFLLTNPVLLMMATEILLAARLHSRSSCFWLYCLSNAFGVGAVLHADACCVAALVTLVFGVAVLGVEALGVDTALSDDSGFAWGSSR